MQVDVTEKQLRSLIIENIELFELCGRAVKRLSKSKDDWPGDRAIALEWDRLQAKRYARQNESTSLETSIGDFLEDKGKAD